MTDSIRGRGLYICRMGADLTTLPLQFISKAKRSFIKLDNVSRA
jgi:hypothetical protein